MNWERATEEISQAKAQSIKKPVSKEFTFKFLSTFIL